VVVLEQLMQHTSVDFLEGCDAVRTLWVSSCPQLQTVKLAGLSRLMQLTLTDCTELREIEGLSSLSALSMLGLHNCNQLHNCDLQAVGVMGAHRCIWLQAQLLVAGWVL
jgi:hypothetical protein